MCVRACVCACVHVCVRACVCVRVRARVCVCRVSGPGLWPLPVSPPFWVSAVGRCSLSGPRVPHPGVRLQPHLTCVFTRVGLPRLLPALHQLP